MLVTLLVKIILLLLFRFKLVPLNVIFVFAVASCDDIVVRLGLLV